MTALLTRESAGEVSYADVGVTAGPALSPSTDVPSTDSTASAAELPSGWHLLRVERTIGNGSAVFEEAKAAIADWAGHRRAGAIVHPEGQPLVVGNDVAVALRVFPLWVTVACRIVEVIDRPDRFGFAYGTLAHHPEAGEERFEVIRNPATDVVRLQIVAVSKPASLLAKLGGPIGRLIQRFMAGRYLDGFQYPTSFGAGSITSMRWWLENRQTGQLTLGQFPNWPLFAIGGALVAQRLTAAGALLGNATVNDGTSWMVTGLWLYWGGDELVRGVNPWRRLIGLGVVGFQVARLLAR